MRANCVAPGSVHSGITSNVSFPDDLTKDEGKLVRAHHVAHRVR